jgi:hypothetical protein
LAGAVPSANLGSLAGAVPSANVGSLGGAVPSANIMGAQPVPQADNISQQKDIMEMQKAKVTAQMPQQQPVQQMVQKAKAKVKAKITEPLSAQSWVNMGNQPSEYQNYLAAWNEKFGKKAK